MTARALMEATMRLSGDAAVEPVVAGASRRRSTACATEDGGCAAVELASVTMPACSHRPDSAAATDVTMLPALLMAADQTGGERFEAAFERLAAAATAVAAASGDADPAPAASATCAAATSGTTSGIAPAHRRPVLSELLPLADPGFVVPAPMGTGVDRATRCRMCLVSSSWAAAAADMSTAAIAASDGAE
jgi:hypothetical protein